MARHSQRRDTKKVMVVLGDGKTEQHYLNHLKKLKNYKFTSRPSLFSNVTIEKVDCYIDEYLSGGCNNIIYITDYDTIINQNKLEKFKKLKRKYSQKKEVLICETMPSIEFWFLLHFCKTTTEFINCEVVTRYLKRYLPDYDKNDSYLKLSKWVEILCSNGGLDKAINNSEVVFKEKIQGNKGDHFPFSTIHNAIALFEETRER
ncbi:MAG: hypothetical protein A2W98_00430 [Bacteroidetes bacterium GWF2_33_38]|nr:MAG: hypothetical protein A2W98_00430 [Bacteroidetes bacterium GWF2_33_38]